jgi:hypothetical protein
MTTAARGMKTTLVINASQVRAKNGDWNEYTSGGVANVLPIVWEHVF